MLSKDGPALAASTGAEAASMEEDFVEEAADGDSSQEVSNYETRNNKYD
jgi:hypothetical protein